MIQMIAIVAASVMLPVLGAVGVQIIHFHQHISRGPQCARCPLYQTACAGFDASESSSTQTDALTLTPEMAI